MCQPAGTWKRNSDIWTPSPRLRLCSCCAEPPALQPHWEKAYPLQGTVRKPSNTQAEMFFSGKQQEVQAALSTGGQCRASHTPRAPCKAVHTRGQLEGHRYPIVYWWSFWSEHFSVERVQDIQFHALKEASAFVLKDNRHSNLAVILEVSLDIIGLQMKGKMSQERFKLQETEHIYPHFTRG